MDHVPFVSVIIPTYNRADSLRRTLASLAEQTYPPERFEVIVVDDGSTDETQAISGERYPYHFVYQHQETRGEIVARNLGADLAKGDMLVFLDDDIEVNPLYIESLVRTHKANPRSVVIGTLIEIPFERKHNLPQNDGKFSTLLDQKQLSEPEEITFVGCMSGILSISRDGFFKVGRMQPLIVGDGHNIWGGMDFGYRAYQCGFSFWRARDALAYHHDHIIASLELRCRRYYRVSHDVHHLFTKYPALRGQIPMFRDKTPISWRNDPLRLIVRKLLRALTAWRPVLWSMEQVAHLLERFAPWPMALRLLYRWIVSSYIYRGYRQGLREYGGPPPVAGRGVA